MNEILPPGSPIAEEAAQLRGEVDKYKGVRQVLRKQRTKGDWAGNILGIAPNKAQDVKDIGTVFQYRHLLELGVDPQDRTFRLTNRLMYRLLSRDDDPALLFEYQKMAKNNPPLGPWARDLIREGVTAALAQAGQTEDPRVRGAAHRIASNVSQFLRSELAEKPIVRQGSKNILDPEAYPPTLLSVAMIAYLPRFQRERAGFVDRLGAFITKPATKRAYVIQLGRKAIKPAYHLLGDPLQADSAGNPKDLPFALHWIEVLTRLQLLRNSPTATRILAKFLRDCSDEGIWSPKNLRSLPKSPSKMGDFAFPLEVDTRTTERRRTDVTFRLALIAKLAGWELDYV